ncbi:MAG: hypothetical protein R3324_01975, partial [Halobacteriales archaeon]|nr:hypothetical protein [Halobacteriales archaeon]
PTAAFTGVQAERSVTVSVAADQQALLALADGHPGGLVEETGDGQLTIDFAQAGGLGANEDAVFKLGDPSGPQANHAFRIVNQGTQPRDLQFEYTLGSGGGDPDPDENLLFTFHWDTTGDGTPDDSVTVSEKSGFTTASIPGVEVGQAVYVVVTVDTRGLSQTSDLSGDLTIRATDLST